jgi:hypothetical protein
MNPDNIEIVLVHTTHSGNIGGVARAMKNMGLSRLTLVAPLEYPAPEATWRAASALDVLEAARVVDTLDEAIVIDVSPGPCRMPAAALNELPASLFASGSPFYSGERIGACSTRSYSAAISTVTSPPMRPIRVSISRWLCRLSPMSYA